MKTAASPTVKPSAELANLTAQVEQLQVELQQARETEKRALADYQNLVRRQQDERMRMIKLASLELVKTLVQPLSHLSLAAAQIKNQGLDMVIHEFWQQLEQFGLSEIKTVGQPFNPQLMEAVEKKANGERVVAEVSKGYTLNGEVIQHAKVLLD